jgi:hypothetical protein
MQESSPLAPEVTPGRAFVREYLTPLNAAAAWAALVVTGSLWAPLAPLSDKLAFAGEVLVFTLALQLLHELGHVLAGALVGLPFRALTVGLLSVRRESLDGGSRLRWAVNGSWWKVAGCVERDFTPAPDVREALTITALGGPIASLVVGTLLLASPAPWQGLGFVSLFIGAFNAVPSALLGQPSDGMIIYRLWSRTPAAVAWRAPLCDVPEPDGAVPSA